MELKSLKLIDFDIENDFLLIAPLMELKLGSCLYYN